MAFTSTLTFSGLFHPLWDSVFIFYHSNIIVVFTVLFFFFCSSGSMYSIVLNMIHIYTVQDGVIHIRGCSCHTPQVVMTFASIHPLSFRYFYLVDHALPNANIENAATWRLLHHWMWIKLTCAWVSVFLSYIIQLVVCHRFFSRMETTGCCICFLICHKDTNGCEPNENGSSAFVCLYEIYFVPGFFYLHISVCFEMRFLLHKFQCWLLFS